jgi:hypothetical protein
VPDGGVSVVLGNRVIGVGLAAADAVVAIAAAAVMV